MNDGTTSDFLIIAELRKALETQRQEIERLRAEIVRLCADADLMPDRTAEILHPAALAAAAGPEKGEQS